MANQSLFENTSLLFSACCSLAAAIVTYLITIAVMKRQIKELENKCESLKIDVVKLFDTKASKEQLDYQRSDIHNLEASVINRFNKVEDLLNQLLLRGK